MATIWRTRGANATTAGFGFAAAATGFAGLAGADFGCTAACGASLMLAAIAARICSSSSLSSASRRSAPPLTPRTLPFAFFTLTEMTCDSPWVSCAESP